MIIACSTSRDSNNDSITVVPITPSNLVASIASTTQINLSWEDNSTNEMGFKIERKTLAGNYAIVGTVDSNVVAFHDAGLTPSSTYIYRVYSYNTSGNSPTYSIEVTITTTSAYFCQL